MEDGGGRMEEEVGRGGKGGRRKEEEGKRQTEGREGRQERRGEGGQTRRSAWVLDSGLWNPP